MDFAEAILESMSPDMREQAVKVNAALKEINSLAELYDEAKARLELAEAKFKYEERLYKRMIRNSAVEQK
jgi:hypothetical protein